MSGVLVLTTAALGAVLFVSFLGCIMGPSNGQRAIWAIGAVFSAGLLGWQMAVRCMP